MRCKASVGLKYQTHYACLLDNEVGGGGDGGGGGGSVVRVAAWNIV